MTKAIATAARTREILNTYDLHAKKGYGQNFLVDLSVAARCAEAGCLDSAVIEVGPGIGSLTEQLAQRSRKVLAFEVDERLRPVLQETLQAYDNVEVVFQDVLTADLKTTVPELKRQYGSVTVCANLPYYITSPVLFRFFECGPDISLITVMVQKEVADRFSAAPNSKDYGALSVEAQYLYMVKKLFNVPRGCFNPSPNVDSAIVQFQAKPQADLAIDTAGFFDLVQGAFKQRRKTLYNNLKEYTGSAEQALNLLHEAGIGEQARAQELGTEEMIRLYRCYRGM
ncbi:MAG: 16S rRNA (adenine(1518)-N(6)/adenine(1519)-N(6))-dimethyltransferase RsmA [Solobacterium sp.]|jgi:16S rRNA (adenine1518-N6/adenine1519-N6)-dimethyltransferase|nr:16S rRNA (adenine(1518)-N(6)/adenine(1519)-N(6))-dimethyltransferase RsmA [Solobacterium sp.]MCH4223215.1 16S rRNA (adenine(1518)-N(6)/adenine(1519)-N(6))-dimethyltransferase RsmA [Solobacterium sp.]MCH4266443.1 16S rRNA (adenine(1518)-N(6)/adenine(1519)-N(6))-dimethyltransferase RsmA [Solobacterium sp.]